MKSLNNTVSFLGHPQSGPYLGVISMHLLSFLKVKVKNGGYFFGIAKISNIFLGA